MSIPPPDVAVERAELISDKSLIPSTISEVISKAISFMAICVEGPSFRSSMTRQYKQAIVDAHKRGITVKFVTEITKENVKDCKALLSIAQIYHVDGIKGNFAVTDTEYFGAVSLEDKQTISQLIHSNSKQIVEQHKFLFENLCDKAIPGLQRINEVEELLLTERTKVIYGEEKIVSTILSWQKNAQKFWNLCVDSAIPNFSMSLKIRKGYNDAKARGIKIRYVTEITKDNIGQCKELMKYAEVRHLDGLTGNFVVSEKEYLGEAVSKDFFSHLIYSNKKEIVEQQNYLFGNLWNNALSAEQKIRQIEEGITPSRTEIIRETDMAARIAEAISSSSYLCVCASFKNLRLLEKVMKRSLKKLLEDYRDGKHKGIRWIGSIETEEDIEIVNRFLTLGMEIKHINTIPVDFLVTDNEFNLIMDELDEGKPSHQPHTLVSNEPAYLDHFHILFERLWNERATISAYDRILEVQEGIAPEEIRILSNPAEVQKQYINMINSAVSEISLIIATPNALHRAQKFGVVDLLSKATKERGVKVNLIIPGYKEQEDSRTGGEVALPSPRLFFDVESLSTLYPNIEVRRNVPFIRQTSKIKSTFLIVDRLSLLIVDLKDDSKDDFMLATGYATYSSSASRTQSYTFIFDTIWRQAELYEKLKNHDNMQREFINIAAHELRTPTQAIVGYSEMMLNFPEKKDIYQNAISRNAERLIRLSGDILDVARIESQTLKLNKSSFELNEKIKNVITDIKESSHWITDAKSQNINIIFEPGLPLNVEADKLRIFQVMSNLLNNALKFTDKGSITISILKDEKMNEAIVKVTDTGKGLDKEILPRLFTKFASKSDKGTGLGLFISKAIVEAHGGRVEGYNNPEGNGATFVFTLPLS
jgi:two-component system, OmpR family, sensor histidine kinase VicK